MDVVDIIKNALRYPIENYKTWTMMAVIFFIIGILQAAMTYNVGEVGEIILSIIEFIFMLLALGYALQILKGQINGSFIDNEMIRLEEDFIGGIKAIIVLFIYEIIPLVIVFILSAIAGISDQLANIVTISANSSGAAASLNAVPTNVMATFMTSIVIISIIAFILYVICYLFSVIGIGKLAETDSMSEALNFREVSSRISSIGWGRYIVFIVATIIILVILGLISTLIGYIPVVGLIISNTIVGSFALLFLMSAIAGIYDDIA